MLTYLRDTPQRVGYDASKLIDEAIKIDITTKEMQALLKKAEVRVQTCLCFYCY